MAQDPIGRVVDRTYKVTNKQKSQLGRKLTKNIQYKCGGNPSAALRGEAASSLNPILFHTDCLRVTTAVMKHFDQKQIGEERVI